ncbi:MAG: hypothetical protein M1830_003674 [Pleopsidium flavum]|nr:MAG: hypothetical protein M1830_003674 [Pleopsidium flavum]
MTSLDAARTMPDADQETPNHHFANDRWYTPLPTLHFVGMTVALQMTVFLGTVVVFGPADKPATAAIVDQILEFGDVAGTMLPPSLLEDLCRNPSMLERVRKLQYVHYAGAPLSVATGNLISQHVKLVPAIGSTEAGAYFPGVRNDPDWNYYSFRPSMGVEFEQRTKELYELVFRRKQECERWQQVFFVYPDVDYFPTKDLWAKHPTKPDLWDYAGRTDDLVILSHGEDLHASKMEAEITNHPTIRSAIIGGEGRKRPFLILELERETEVPKEGKKTENDGLWSAVEKANEQCSEYVRLSKELTMFTEPTKPFVRTAKGTAARRECLTLYKDEISALYAALGE